jgi:DNA repair protein RadA/Sms
VIVLDSIQTTVSNNISSVAGSSAQVKEITFELMNYCKSRQTICFIIGHVTKDGGIAGPKVLEHMVDVVISFEGDKDSHQRTLRALKNRFGSTKEIGIFEMNENGLVGVENPSLVFTRSTDELNGLGRGMTCLLEGKRALLVETQALAIDSQYGSPVRTTQGYDNKRLVLLIAIIEKHLGLPIGRCDIYINTVGGLKINSRESDLAIISSLLSSYHSKPINTQTVYLGEVDLTGEIRAISDLEERLKELYAHGYKKVILPQVNLEKLTTRYKNISYIGVKKINELVDYIF